MKTRILFLSIFTLLSITMNAQTSVPDDAFETYLETHDANGNVVAVGDINSLGDGTDGNNLVTTSKINAVTKLYLGFLGIEDLTGLQDFAALEDFQFNGNNPNVTNVDLTANSNIRKFYSDSFPNLNTINTSNLNNLEEVTLQGLPNLTTLDFSTNSNLLKLYIFGSSILSSLNIAGLVNLVEVYLASSNVITMLDFTTNTGLKKLSVTQLPNLATLNLSGLSQLEELSLNGSNAMTSLDASALIALNQIVISNYGQLSALDLKTGSTASINFVQLNRNPLLTCVEVDPGIPLNGVSTWSRNNGPIFNEDCSNPATYVPDDNFEAYLEANAMGNSIANDDKVFTNNINTIATLDVSGKSISDLTGIESFTALVELNASSNTLVSVDVSKNTVLENLFLNDNSITSIDVSKNTALKQFWVRQNNITILDVSKNVNLEWFVASRNSIQNLDLSLNTNLTVIEIHTNDLRTLNLKNITPNSTFFALGNLSLTCIQVDNPSVWTTNHSSQLNNNASFSADCSYPTTNVPDAAFENYLETHDRDGNIVAIGAINSMGNGVPNDQTVYTHRINTVTLLDPRENGIASLQGLEGFRDLKTFGYSGGLSTVTTVDVSQNLKLEKIFLGFTPTIANIIFGNLPNLTFIQMGFDNVTNIDLSGLPNLEEIRHFSGPLASLDTSANPELRLLGIQSTAITFLDVSTNLKLENLSIACSLSALDLSNNVLLSSINLIGNQLKSLNINNGANQLINTASFNITNNPDLTCIEVSDLAYANANWTAIDSQHVFNTDCSSIWTIMTSPATTAALLAITPSIDTDGTPGISLAEAAAYTGTLDLSNTGITDIAGLLAFSSITTLDISGNGITEISSLTGSGFSIISKTGKIKQVKKAATMGLQNIILSNNNFEVLDLNSFSSLTSLDISNNPDLKTVSFQNGNNANITSFNSVNTPNLSCILVDDVNASYLSTWIKDVKSEFVATEAQCRAEVLTVYNFNLSNTISLYPNPVTDYLKVELSNQLEIKNIQIYNVIGKLVNETKNLEIDFTKITKGVYLIKIITNKGILTKKVIKN